MTRIRTFLIFCAVLSLFPAYSALGASENSRILTIFVSVPPQVYITKEIGKEFVRVESLLKPGKNPHIFEPTPQQIQAFERADVYFPLWFPFDTRIKAIVSKSFQRVRILDCTQGIPRRTIRAHGKSGNAPVDEADPHVWLSPVCIRRMAENICQALMGFQPEHQDIFRRNLGDFLQRLAAVDQRIRKLLAPFKGRKFYVFHPAFGYFGDAYSMIQTPLEIEGKSPSPRQIAGIISKARAEGVRVLFVQPQFDTRNADIIAQAIDGVVIPLDPMKENVLENLETIAETLATHLK